MSINFFLYRRFSHWITCELKLPFDDSKVSLNSKYEVASFHDVFCHPFYWQVFNWIDQPPKLVIDCGAHCGHFSVLAESCFRAKFESSNTKYILIEPNPFLLPTIHKNLSDANLLDRAEVKQGILGIRSGRDTLWINSKNYLVSSLVPTKSSKPHSVQYIDLLELVEKQTVDLLKIDIEGGEFNFVRSNLAFLAQVKLIFMELHESDEVMYQELFNSLKSVGLTLVSKPIKSNNNCLAIFQRLT